MFQRILIVGHGEHASRVARTCKRLGITAIVGVDADHRVGVHADACDEIVEIPLLSGGAVDPKAIAEAAKEAECEAVYPGYRVDSPEIRLAEALEAADIAFIGPDPEAVKLAGDRRALRRLSESLGIRFLPGSAEPATSLPDAIEMAEAIGYPVSLRKASAFVNESFGRFDDDDELMDRWDDIVRDTGLGDEGSQRGYSVEKFVERARVIDVLLAADLHGEVLGLGETEVTLSTAGRLLVEESPSPELAIRADGEALRLGLVDVAIRLGTELRTPGLITIRFELTPESRVWASDVLLGLPEQHGVIEMVTGLDLVGLQLAIASGEPLPNEVHTVQPSGHALGAAITAKGAPDPQTPISEVRFAPAPQRTVRFEPGVQEGVPVDPIDGVTLCKVTAYAPIRHQALLTLDRMLAELEIRPLETNREELRKILGHESFRAGQYDTAFLRALGIE